MFDFPPVKIVWDWLLSCPVYWTAWSVLVVLFVGVVLVVFSGVLFVFVCSKVRIFGFLLLWIEGLTGYYPKRKDALQHKNMFAILTELRIKAQCDRAYVLVFHNGSEFLPSNPIWRLTCIQETTRDGVSYALPNRESILASTIHRLIDPMITGTPECRGLVMVSPCGRCGVRADCRGGLRRISLVQVSELPAGYERYFLEKQGVRTMFMSSLIRNGNVFGVVCVDFCSSPVPEDEGRKNVVSLLCRATSDLQYVLQFKRVPAELIK